jgi:uncharacterized protein (DUF2164 family)
MIEFRQGIRDAVAEVLKELDSMAIPVTTVE